MNPPRRCQKCSSPRLSRKCWKCKGPTIETPPEWTEPKMPDIAYARHLAKEKGYALGVHGSLERDVDLIAVAWTEDAASADDLADHIAEGMDAKVLVREEKPLGRIAYSIQIDGWFKVIDLSVAPMLGAK